VDKKDEAVKVGERKVLRSRGLGKGRGVSESKSESDSEAEALGFGVDGFVFAGSGVLGVLDCGWLVVSGGRLGEERVVSESWVRKLEEAAATRGGR